MTTSSPPKGRPVYWTRENALPALAAAVEKAGGRPTLYHLGEYGAPSIHTLRKLFGSYDEALVLAVGTMELPIINWGPDRPKPETGRPLPY